METVRLFLHSAAGYQRYVEDAVPYGKKLENLIYFCEQIVYIVL